MARKATPAKEPPKLNVLAAYPYMSKGMVRGMQQYAGDFNFLLDSGAFTAWKLNKPISLDDYCKFIETLDPKPWRYFALDVIGDPHGTRRNYEIMLRRGFNPVPVLTRGETLDELDRLYETSDCVGLGGVSGADRASYSWLRAVFERVGKRRAHILGMTSLDWVKYLKPYSCDSSSWLSGARYGSAYLYMGNGIMKQVSKEDFLSKPDEKLCERVRRYGVDPYDLAKDERWKGRLGVGVLTSAGSWIDFSLDCGKVLDTKLFLAFTCKGYADVLKRQFDRVRTQRADMG